MDSALILPGSLEYALALQHLPPPPGWGAMAAKTNGEMALIGTVGGNGLMEAVTLERFLEYANDGELEAREAEVAALDAETDGVIIGR